MKTPQNKLSAQEQNQLLALLQDNVAPKSAEISKRIVTDQNGISRELGGKANGVLVDQYGIPQVLTEEQGSILDCGHMISSLTEVLGKCNFGHVICQRHELYQCHEEDCKKLLCHLCAVFDDEGHPMCPDHNKSSWGPVLGALVVFIGIAIYVFGNN